MCIFFTQWTKPLKPLLLLTLLSFFPLHQASSSSYIKHLSSAAQATGEMVSNITHKVKYTFVPVSPDHFPELTLGQVLTALEDSALEEADSETVCQDLHFKYMKDEYSGILSFSAIDFGNIHKETRYSLSSSKKLHSFLSNFIPKEDRTKSFLLLNPKMSSKVIVGDKTKKWKKSCLYEYVLSDPPTGTDFKRSYIRLTAWRTKSS